MQIEIISQSFFLLLIDYQSESIKFYNFPKLSLQITMHVFKSNVKGTILGIN